MIGRNVARVLRVACLAALLGAGAGCIYRMSVQQGNLLEEPTIQQVAVGMTRSQVQFLLGTPMVRDPFHEDRWDYMYYLQPGRSNDVMRRWCIVYFEGDRVSRVERDVEPDPVS
jgi:outer membrane protein assembly factor BamE